MSAEKIINTPATDGSGLRSDRAANTDRRRSIQSEMDRSPRSVFLLLLLRHFYYELITIVRPALVQLSCVRFMNLVLPSLLFLANKSSVIGLIGWRFFFFLYTWEIPSNLWDTHYISQPLTEELLSESGWRKKRGKRRQAQRRDTSNYRMASFQTKNKILGLSDNGSSCRGCLIEQTYDLKS